MHQTRTRIRRDGWTIDRQVKFILALHKTHCVSHAAAAVGMTRESAYRLRARPGHADFARAWDIAVTAKGHTRSVESHTVRARISPASSRKGHKSHAGEQSAQHRQSRQFPAARGGRPCSDP
jgi:hypothetical protein